MEQDEIRKEVSVGVAAITMTIYYYILIIETKSRKQQVLCQASVEHNNLKIKLLLATARFGRLETRTQICTVISPSGRQQKPHQGAECQAPLGVGVTSWLVSFVSQMLCK
jgi:hypothetical protein